MGRPYRRPGAAETGDAYPAAVIRAGGSRSEGAASAPIPLPGDSRAALRPSSASLADLSAEGAITLPDGVPSDGDGRAAAAEGHGDYATNVALQLAKKAGQPPRDLAGLVAGPAARRPTASRRSRSRARVPQHQRRRGCAGRGRRRHRGGRASVRRLRGPGAEADASTSSSSRPTRPARSRWRAPAGRRSATPWPGCSRRPAPTWPASTTSTTTAPRSTGSQPVAARGRAARADARGRLPGQLHHRHRRSRCVAEHPEAPRLPDDEALEVFRALRRRR